MTNNEPVVLTREHAETLYATNYDKWPQTRDPLDDLRRGRTVVVPVLTEAQAREAFREHATKQGYYLSDWGIYEQVWLAAHKHAGLLIEDKP